MIGDVNAVGGIGTVLCQLKSMPIPDGWLSCDGKCYDGMMFPTLFELLKHNRMQGDPQGYFRVPNEKPFLPAGVLITLIIRATA
ncbi:MAG: hypothetical protein DMF62_03670 [Acidobacteria bacterium]|nr:MAG: hypothetical protein DMF62_03670 [Acidobacteriota bacterium]